ncbi:HsdM family class I SAM-dependent methyltransferase [Sphingomonas faeni]|uniref:HsdM family class I SAM-dependent methyltransferase n=1 Tax=Sphingomonas faeni TaxID=185950 RepID=UPI003360E90B
MKELLTRSSYGIGLQSGQVVVDSKLSNSRRRPDLVVYHTLASKPLRGPDFSAAVFEIKSDDAIATNGKAIAKEKRSYVQPGTRWFFLADQRTVWRIDVSDAIQWSAALDARGPLPAAILSTWTWLSLEEPEAFASCFGVIAAGELAIERELVAFQRNQTRFAFLDASGDQRALFGATVRTASETIRQAVEHILLTVGVGDLRTGLAAIAELEADYGRPVYDWANSRRPIEFAAMFDAKSVANLSDEKVVDYEVRLDRLMADLEPVIYAVRIETDLLQQYAKRQGVTDATLLKLDGDANKNNKQLVAALIYETASLILSRLLTIRFCEDYGLFRVRYISNGGIEVFWRFADHFALPMQELLRQTYRHAGNVFRSIFDANLLDWAVRRDDAVLSDALLRVAFILSRWNFATVRGDILSGVYDQYLDVSQRRRLGEVYTRPEIARFMLDAAGWGPQSTVLDPACGTGTFLVEALAQRLDALAEVGAVSVDNVRQIVSRLHGLDISSFSVTLAQIQVFWHLIDVVSGKTSEEIREFARSILPVLRFFGGWSSLDMLGDTFDDERSTSGAQSGIAFRIAHATQRKAQALIPPGFERTVKGSYDIVVMNPPYIRAERSGSAKLSSAYDGVTFKNTDTSIFFIYRALKQWVKPGGRLAFIVPIGITEATYAGPLRRVLDGYRICLIADLEGLGKVTFRGVKRATVIMVIEKTVASPDDQIDLLQLDASTLIGDVIDFNRARRSVVLRSDLDRLAYLPTALRAALQEVPKIEVDTFIGPDDGTSKVHESLGQSDNGGQSASNVVMDPSALAGDEISAALSSAIPAWIEALRGDEVGGDAIITKLAEGDAKALRSMRELPRLGEIVRVVYVKRNRGRIAEVLTEPPTQERYAYRPELLFNYGVKLGGAGALARPDENDAITLYKGQNVFPQGLLGEPMGAWSPTSKRESTRYIYSYADQLSFSRTYAAREISQLPTVAPVTLGQGFQNTAYIIELVQDFPLNVYLLSRLPQFYAARVLRSSIIEDLGCHWYKRTLTLLPIPSDLSSERVQRLVEAGAAVLDADSDLANRYRAIDALLRIGTTSTRTLGSLIVDGAELAEGVDLNGASEEGVLVVALLEAGEELRSTDLFSARVPDARLRTYMRFVLTRKLEQEPEALLRRADMLGILVPVNLDDVSASIASLEADSIEQRYADALDTLDSIVAELCGITPATRDHMIAAMKNDPILSKMRPMLAQRGLRIQPYADHGETDRYG